MDKNINNPHDKFFKFIVSNKEVAIAFLKSFLPEKVIKLIDFGSLIYEQKSYIDENLKEAFSDVIFKFKLFSENEVFVFISILIEHKSYPDKYTPVQILKYIANGYEKQLKQDKKLTLILPFIYYHGKENWKYKQLSELIENLPKHLHSFVPANDTIFVDLNRMSDKQIKGLNNMFLASALIMQKYSYDSHLVFIKFIETIKETEDKEFIEGNLLNDLLVVIFKITQVNKENLLKSIKELPANKKTKIMTLYQSIVQEGIEKGVLQMKIEVVINGYKNGINTKTLAKITGLDMKQVEEIIANYKDN